MHDTRPAAGNAGAERRLILTKRMLAAAVICLLCLAGIAGADLPWPKEPTAGQAALKAYTETVNADLVRLGEPPINSLFECWPAYAGLGITAEDGQEAPDAEGDLQIAVWLKPDCVHYLRFELVYPVSEKDPEPAKEAAARFRRIASALIRGSAPESMSLEDAGALLDDVVRRVEAYPDHSFEDLVLLDQADVPQAFFTYGIGAYGTEERNLLALTLVFARPGGGGAAVAGPVPDVTEATPPPSNDDGDASWVGYFQPMDDAEHFEIFVTPTPEPDSPVFPY